VNPAVLYVEDDSFSRQIMKLILVNMMKLPHVTIFEDSQDFVAKAQKLEPKPDIILLDIHVKPMSGFEMLQHLRQLDRFHNTPIVALTASVMVEEIHQLRVAGFDGVIAKPFDQETFPDMLRQILQGEKIWRVNF
jgi:CheY-like chemotaxis protein